MRHLNTQELNSISGGFLSGHTKHGVVVAASAITPASAAYLLTRFFKPEATTAQMVIAGGVAIVGALVGDTYWKQNQLETLQVEKLQQEVLHG